MPLLVAWMASDKMSKSKNNYIGISRTLRPSSSGRPNRLIDGGGVRAGWRGGRRQGSEAGRGRLRGAGWGKRKFARGVHFVVFLAFRIAVQAPGSYIFNSIHARHRWPLKLALARLWAHHEPASAAIGIVGNVQSRHRERCTVKI